MDGNGHGDVLEPERYQLDPATELTFMKAQLDVMTKALAEGKLSDGAHTHEELYRHRMWLTIYAIEAWKWWDGFEAVKSRKHADGELCFGGGWFIVMVKLPAGWISYHYEDEYWDLFTVPEAELPPEYDGHTADDVVDRMRLSVGQVKLANVDQRLARPKFVELEERIKALVAERNAQTALYNTTVAKYEERLDQAAKDASWALSELGHDHWQECHTTDDGCYLCAGYLELKEKYPNG